MMSGSRRSSKPQASSSRSDCFLGGPVQNHEQLTLDTFSGRACDQSAVAAHALLCPGSISHDSWRANLTARSILSGSASNAPSEHMRRQRACKICLPAERINQVCFARMHGKRHGINRKIALLQVT